MNETQVGKSDTVVSLENIIVRYPYEQNRATSLKEFMIRKVKRDIQTLYITALNGLSTEIKRGETFGIIGRNGAGKSTLLKVVARIIHPTQGRLRVWGKVASLLGVGAGFHPELSGTENIFLYSSLLGRSHAYTEERFRDIVDFAELEDFIDSPIRTYSTGMIARLGFAVAMVDRPEILLIDEVLAVGDEIFQAKCKNKFKEFQDQGTTLIIVSHGLEQIESICQTAIWLHQGQIRGQGAPSEVVNEYRRLKDED